MSMAWTIAIDRGKIVALIRAAILFRIRRFISLQRFERIRTMDDFTHGSATARASTPAAAADGWEEDYAHSLGMQAYVYGFPWIYNTQLRWLWTTPEGRKVSKENGKPDLYAPVNSFHRNEQLANPDNSKSGGSPNCDTLYATAWLDVAHDPIVIS